MTKIKDKNGKSVEAFDLIMHRKVAMDILSGLQRVVCRFATIKNVLKFETGLHTNEFKDVDYLHLHDAEKTWFVDVKLDAIGRTHLHHNNEKIFHDYNDHTMDFFFDMTRKANENEDNCFMVYVLPIAEIVKTNLI